MVKSEVVKKIQLASQMKKTRVCARQCGLHSWFRIIVLLTSFEPITEQQKFQAHQEV